MPIEIKQLTIKSTIDDQGEQDDQDNDNCECDQQELKRDILNECRRLVREMMNEKGLR